LLRDAEVHGHVDSGADGSEFAAGLDAFRRRRKLEHCVRRLTFECLDQALPDALAVGDHRCLVEGRLRRELQAAVAHHVADLPQRAQHAAVIQDNLDRHVLGDVLGSSVRVGGLDAVADRVPDLGLLDASEVDEHRIGRDAAGAAKHGRKQPDGIVVPPRVVEFLIHGHAGDLGEVAALEGIELGHQNIAQELLLTQLPQEAAQLEAGAVQFAVRDPAGDESPLRQSGRLDSEGHGADCSSDLSLVGCIANGVLRSRLCYVGCERALEIRWISEH